MLCTSLVNCGWGHLASLTAGSCFWVHVGIEGKFPARTSCCFTVPSVLQLDIKHILSSTSVRPIFCFSTVLVFLLRELQEDTLFRA